MKMKETDLITMGFNIGLYSAAQMIQEGLGTDATSIEALKRVAAQDLHKMTGTPIEDFASQIDPMMANVVSEIKSRRSHE